MNRYFSAPNLDVVRHVFKLWFPELNLKNIGHGIVVKEIEKVKELWFLVRVELVKPEGNVNCIS